LLSAIGINLLDGSVALIERLFCSGSHGQNFGQITKQAYIKPALIRLT